MDNPDSSQEVQEGRGMSGNPKVGPGNEVILFNFFCLTCCELKRKEHKNNLEGTFYAVGHG